jgi:hypothetical protein
VKNGIPFDAAHAMEDWELLAYAIIFAQFENGNQEWSWEDMRFIENPP